MTHFSGFFSTGSWSEGWFEYPVKVHPHHTDYAGMVWHGTYLTWMEEARVEALRSLGIDYADLVTWGCDLLVMEMNLRYRQAVRMGATILVRVKMRDLQGVRIHWDYELCAYEPVTTDPLKTEPLIDDRLPEDRLPLYPTFPNGFVHLTAVITLVAVDRAKGKIMRKLPPAVATALDKLQG
ncbi:MAG: thioesterase family protein [Synechococcales bacterium]|nr:thioesterase family protein [Synechococcales bacterium]